MRYEVSIFFMYLGNFVSNYSFIKNFYYKRIKVDNKNNSYREKIKAPTKYRLYKLPTTLKVSNYIW